MFIFLTNLFKKQNTICRILDKTRKSQKSSVYFYKLTTDYKRKKMITKILKFFKLAK